MRYSQFLRDLIRNYNYDPESLAGSYSIVSETKENFTQRYRDSKQPMIFEKISNGIFWLIQESHSTYWLFPQAKLKVDEFNYRSLQILFECRGFQDDYPTDFSLIRPSKLFLIEGTEQFEHEARGILDFSGHTTESTLGKRLIDLESFMVDTQIFFNQNTENDLRQEAPPLMSLVEEQLTQLSQKIEELPQQIFEQVSQSLEERLQPIEDQVNQLNQQRQADKKQQTDIQSGIFFINHIIKEVPTQILEQVSQLLEERFQPIEDQLNQQQQQDIQSDTALINQTIEALPVQIMQQVSQSLEGRLQAIETQVNQLNQQQQQDIQLDTALINQTIEALPTQIMQQISQSLEGRLQAIETQVNQLNQELKADKKQQADIPSDIATISQFIQQASQSVEEQLKPIKEQIKERHPFEALKLIGTKLNQLGDTENDDDEEKIDNLPETSDEKPELSAFAKDMISAFNQVENFGQLFASGRLALSMNPKAFARNYKPKEEDTENSAKNSHFVADKNGLFWAIRDHPSNNYLLVLNQDRLTPQNFKNTFNFLIKHISQVFDGGDKYDKGKHTELKIIYPAIIVKHGEQIELKVRGELEFY